MTQKLIETLTIEQFMYIRDVVESFKDDENQQYTRVLNYIYPGHSMDKKEADIHYTNILNILQVQPDLTMRFTYNGVEYGFIPNLDNLQVNEFVDLDNYTKTNLDQLHRIAAILYRPIIKTKGKTYKIEKYTGTDKYCEIMKGVDYKVIQGALVFFYLLKLKLLESLDTYILEETKKMNQKKD